MPSFEDILCQFHDKVTAQNIANTVIANPEKLDELMDCFFHENIRICQRAAWPVGIIGKTETHLLYPYVERLLTAIESPIHDALVRNTVRTFQFMDFPEDLEGRVFDTCLTLLMDIDQAVAIRVFSMTVCTNICVKYPELAIELIPVLEEQIPHGSTGFKNRGMKMLAKLRKLEDTESRR